MGLSGLQKSFFENFSDKTDANIGGHGIPAVPTQPLTSRGCSCLSCTNKADGIHLPDWCTSCSVGALETSAPPENSIRLIRSLARLVHFLLWQAAKPSGDKCTPLEASYSPTPHFFSCSKSISEKPACFSVTERLWSLR